MSDETRPNHPVDDETEDSEAKEQRRPPSRLDRLMRAKDKADKEAARWSEIEDLGTPVPSHDQPGQDITQPLPVEPARQEGDTPVGEDTPSQPQPPVSPTPTQPPSQPSQRPAPPFPHPTDQPLPPQGAPPPHPTDRGFTPTPPPVPPPPAQTDEFDTRRGVRPPGGQPHQRYQPPPEDIEQVRLDSNGMPLPRHVPREDADATLVGASAYRDDAVPPLAPPTQPHGYAQPEWPATQPPPPTRSRAVSPLAPSRAVLSRRGARPRVRGLRFSWGCLVRAMVLALVFGLVSAMLGGGAAAIYYARVTAPSFEGINQIGDLQARALQFQTTRIRDREGNILYELNDPHGGFRDYVTLDEVSPWVIVATVATEERNYFINPGFSIPAIIRAVIRNIEEGQTVSGASTITQQLTRALLLPEEERTERSYQRKIKEIFLAAELGRRFTKREILELYLNQIYYGNLAYGVEAAAQTYFGKSARDLTLAEASFLAGLPQAPAIYDPVTNRDTVIQRQQAVLQLMLEARCIDTGDSGLDLSAYCVTDAQIAAAQPELTAIASREFHAPALQAHYPHWVVYVQHLLESDPTIGPAIYTSGFDVYTTLDPRLQDLAQQNVDLTLSGLTDRNVNNASVVIIDPHSGAILAMVGSKDFNDEAIDGQVNIALTPQQPGSSIKPFTYLAAFRKGWTPATVIWDVPISYEIPGFGVYAPENYDGRFHGPVPVRAALANSYNDPAVQTLDFVGVPALLQVLNDVGITSLGDPSNPNNYGLSLTLGAGDVYLLEWANAFATLANGGQWHPPYAIDRIERNGQVIEGYPYQVPEGKQVLEPDLVYLLTTILSDKEARIPAFGANTPISPPYPAAAKTGTTNDFRDNWTMGFTTELAVGVWVGNTDNSPMNNVSGVTGAGPIWRGVMDGSQQWYPAQPFTRPAGIFDQTVCSDDGALPSPYCTEHSQVRTDVFATRMPPPAADQGLYRQLKVDQFTGLIANENCPDFTEDKFFVVLPNPSQLIDLRTFERDWLLNTDDGRAWAAQRVIPTDRFEDPPTEACKTDTPKPTIVIDSPQQGSEQIGVVTVIGTVDAPNFSHYTVEFGVGDSPQAWGILQAETFQPVHNGQLGQADLSAYGSGIMSIRVTVYDTQGHHAERHVAFMFVAPTPTPAPTAMPTPTEIPMPTLPPATETPTKTPTETPTLTPTPG